MKEEDRKDGDSAINHYLCASFPGHLNPHPHPWMRHHGRGCGLWEVEAEDIEHRPANGRDHLHLLLVLLPSSPTAPLSAVAATVFPRPCSPAGY